MSTSSSTDHELPPLHVTPPGATAMFSESGLCRGKTQARFVRVTLLRFLWQTLQRQVR